MTDARRKICVLGLGYIGLPTASLLGTKGYHVVGVDVSEHTVTNVNQGMIPFVEPDLDILVKSAVNSGNLKAQFEPEEADVFILAVPTPLKNGCEPDLSYVEDATRKISPYVRPGNLVILESTSPVGTTEEIVARILVEAGHKVGEEVHVAHCPERVLPGRILTELVENDRVVGGINETSAEVAQAFYEEFVGGEVYRTDAPTSELSKLAENSFRDVNIAFANELSIICDKAGINAWELIRLINKHPRVNVLQPGPGVGGHCIALDPWFIVSAFSEEAKLIRASREVNDSKPAWVVDKVKAKADKFKRPVIFCLGLAFKADVDDLRESPALAIVRRLRDEDVGDILVCEPNLHEHSEFPLTSLQDGIRQADIVLLLVDHRQFRSLKALDLQDKILIDTRGAIR